MPAEVNTSILNRRLLWLTGIRLLVIASAAVPYYLYQFAFLSEAGAQEVRISSEKGEGVATSEPPEAESPSRRPPEELRQESEKNQFKATVEELLLRDEQQERQKQTVKILVAVTSVLTLLYIALLRILRSHPVVQAYIHFSGDLLTITLLLYDLPEAASNFSLLYVFTIMVAAALLRRSVAVLVATAAFGLYVSVMMKPELLEPFLTWIRSLAVLGSEDLLAPPVGRMTGVSLKYDIAVHAIGFYGVAFLTSYLAQGATRAEEKLRAQYRDLTYLQVLHEDVLQSISSGLAVLDLDGVINSVNRAGEEVLGLTEEELVGRHITEIGLLDAERWQQETDNALAETRGRSELIFERSGATICLGFNITQLRDGEGAHRGYLWIFQDLTEWRELEEQLRIKDRMATIGEMAAGLAHEVGNPLAAISGSVQMLGTTFEGNSAQRKLLDITLKESRRLDRILKSFLRMARPRQNQNVEFDIAALLAEDVALLRNSDEVLATHRIRAEFEPPTVVIAADPDQISQLFWNLARNALQAMPEGGTLTIGGRLVEEKYNIAFQDTGNGMTAEEKARIFHPFKSFFDNGTGLGMAIVYRIVEEHQGEIRVESELGHGSVVSIDLPLRPAGAASAAEMVS